MYALIGSVPNDAVGSAPTVNVRFVDVHAPLPAESLHHTAHVNVPSAAKFTVMLENVLLTGVEFVLFACHTRDVPFDQFPHSCIVSGKVRVSAHFISKVAVLFVKVAAFVVFVPKDAFGAAVSIVIVLFAASQSLLPAESLQNAVHLYSPSAIPVTVTFQYELLFAEAFVWFACHPEPDQLPYRTKSFTEYVSLHFMSKVTSALELL